MPTEYQVEPLRFSRLKHMSKSAAHFLENPSVDTASTRKGQGTHSYLLGDKERVVVYRDGARNEKHAKYQAFLEEHPGAHVLSPSEAVDVEGMRQSLEKHQRAMDLLDGFREQRITWTEMGRECAGTPDVVTHINGDRIAVELKTSRTAHPDRFRWEARRMLYHCQCAWYMSGLEKTLVYEKKPIAAFFVVVVESTRPYPVTVFEWDPESLKMGQKQNRLWLEQLLGCERTGHFPGYVEADVTLSILDEDNDGLDWSGDE